MTQTHSAKPEEEVKIEDEESEETESGSEVEGDENKRAELTDMANTLPDDAASKSKQTRGEKKARKAMSKLGLKPVSFLVTQVVSLKVNKLILILLFSLGSRCQQSGYTEV